jgi:hypothetical protein
MDPLQQELETADLPAVSFDLYDDLFPVPAEESPIL